MSSSDGGTRHGKMTDTQLDQLLAATNRELLEYIEATAEPGQVLTKIMALSAQEPHNPGATTTPSASHESSETLAAAMLGVRISARDLARELDRTCALARANDLTRARDLDRTCALANDLTRTRDLDRTRNLAFALASALDLDLASASDLDLILIRASAFDRTRNLARASDLARDLDRALTLARDLASDLAHTHDLDRALDLARDLDSALDLARDRAGGLVSDLDAQHVDASDADLSGMEIRQLDLLNGIVWTRQTLWPPAIAAQVEAHSAEIRPGTYQVRLGDTQDRDPLALA